MAVCHASFCFEGFELWECLRYWRTASRSSGGGGGGGVVVVVLLLLIVDLYLFLPPRRAQGS